MSIFFMFDNHTFARLDDKPVDEAMDLLEIFTDKEGGYGFMGCKGEHGNKSFGWSKGDAWREKAKKMLQTDPKEINRRVGPKDRRAENREE